MLVPFPRAAHYSLIQIQLRPGVCREGVVLPLEIIGDASGPQCGLDAWIEDFCLHSPHEPVVHFERVDACPFPQPALLDHLVPGVSVFRCLTGRTSPTKEGKGVAWMAVRHGLVNHLVIRLAADEWN